MGGWAGRIGSHITKAWTFLPGAMQAMKSFSNNTTPQTSVSNGFFIFSAKQSDGGSTAYLALDDKDALYAASTKSKAESFVSRKGPAGGFELLVFLTVTTTSGSTTTSTPTLKAIDEISGALKAESESSYRFGFALSS